MSGIPFLYVNIFALCCGAFILVTFLAAAKKTPEIKSFIVVMIAFVLWTGGSVLMRLRVFPGIEFWFMVSLLSLFAIALTVYFFVRSFAHLKGRLLMITLIVSTAILEILAAFGLILAPPTMTTLADGGVVFTYTIGLSILIPCIYFFFYVIAMFIQFLKIIKEKGARSPGVMNMICGCAAILLGNVLQIIPGNTFPWDTLSGIVFAVLLMWALYKKRMFQMSLLISRSLLMIISLLICVVSAAYFVAPLQSFFTDNYHLSTSTATTVIVVLFALGLSLLYVLIKKMVDALFSREEQQNKLLKEFSADISQILNTGDILDKLINVIKLEIPVSRIYVCLPDEENYKADYSSEKLAPRDLIISVDSPCVKYLKRSEQQYMIVSDFRKDPLYLSVWKDEKDRISAHGITCIVALRDGADVVGLIMLPAKEKGTAYTYSELSFLETVSSIASIAVKNAGLYEQMYREARVDSLTGAYNYRYFVEKLNLDYADCGDDSLALIFVDVDDFKLYNQLYGALEGDKALRSISEILMQSSETAGTVFRYSGKVFAILLPRCDGRTAEQLAYEIKRRIDSYNAQPERAEFKPLSICCGICVSPFAAASAKELVENADLAVYSAKEGGKDRIIQFKGTAPMTQKASERALHIVENPRNLSSAYQANVSTISALTAAIDAKDHYTGHHSRDVALYSAVLASAAGLTDEQIGMIYEAGLLHDIGKIGIPESVLSKNGALTSDEYGIMKNHVNIAIDMVKHLPDMDYVIPAALSHHERWDGKGYPRGIAAEDIPIAGRVLAIADAYDAMTTDRPYRKGLTPEYAADQIEQNSGTQFDPQLAALFISLIREGELASILAGQR